MDVRMPDGTIIRNVPEGTTRAQLMARYGKAQQPRKSSGPLGWVADNILSPLNEAIIGAPEGIYNAATAVTDPVAHKAWSLIAGKEQADADLAHARRQRRSAVDAIDRTFVSRRAPVARTVGRIGGSLAIPLPGKKLEEGGKLARAGYRAMQGAVGGAAVREVDEDAAAPAAIGAATGVALPPLLRMAANTAPGRMIAAGAQKLANSAPVNWLVKEGDDLAEATLAKLGYGRPALPAKATGSAPPAPTLGRKAEARQARFKAVGVDKPTTGMVTRDPAAYSFEQNIAKREGVGEELAQQMRDAETALVAKGRSMVRGLGGAKGPEATGKGVEGVLDAKRGEMQQVTSRLYDKVREERGDEVVGNLDSLRDLMTDPDMTDNATFDQMRDSLSRRLQRLGLVDGEGIPQGAPGATVRQAEELRKFIRGLGSNAEPGVRMMRSKLIDALDDDVVSAVGDDAFKAARASAKARFDEFSKTFAGKLADEKLAPELLTKRILGDGVKLSDLRALKKSLTNGTDEQILRGQAAWKDVQAQSIDDLLGKSVDADGNLVGSTLFREFNKAAPKFREILEPADFKTLRRLAAATRDVKAYPAGHSVNTSNSATTLANMFDRAAPKIRDGWLKMLAKLGAQHAGAAAVSFPAANVALVVGKAAVGSVAERKAANELMRRIELAKSPEAAARALRALKEAAKKNPAAKDLFERYSAALGGSAAAQE